MATQMENGRVQEAKDDPDSRQSFYKIMWPTKLIDVKIPPAFMKHLADEDTDRATLESPLGSWEVRVLQERGDTFLTDGWEEFAKSHSLGNYECVFFKYNGKMCFDVVVCETNGTARKYRSSTDQIADQDDSASSSFPHFKCTMKSYNIGSKGTLLIPLDFSRSYLHLRSPAKILLRSSVGSYWSVTAILSSSKQFLISKGWKKFADDNLLNKGDTCTFELVENHTLQFRIFRSADEV